MVQLYLSRFYDEKFNFIDYTGLHMLLNIIQNYVVFLCFAH